MRDEGNRGNLFVYYKFKRHLLDLAQTAWLGWMGSERKIVQKRPLDVKKFFIVNINM